MTTCFPKPSPAQLVHQATNKTGRAAVHLKPDVSPTL